MGMVQIIKQFEVSIIGIVMAEAKSSEVVHGENEEPEVFHDIDCHDLNPPESNALALLMKFTQPKDKPLPVGVITEWSMYALIKQVTYSTIGDNCHE